LLLVNRKDLMGEHTNTVAFNVVAWVTAVAMIALTIVLMWQGVAQWVHGGGG
jgi:Mn2+/Fe2+ NRAMP family transporter